MRRDDLVVGIDLGTTNTALGFVRRPSEEGAHPHAEVLPLPQAVRPGDVQPRNALPSFLYLAQPGELPFLLVSDVHDPAPLWNGALLVGLPPVEVLALPALPASGTGSLALAVPNVGPAVASVCFYVQGVFVEPGTAAWVGAGTPVVLLDASF